MDGANFSTSVCNGLMVAALRGQLDMTDAGDIASALACLAEGGGCLIVDMSAVDFIDCAAMGALLRVRQLADDAGGNMVLAGAHGYAARILDLTCMGEAFSIYGSVLDAVASKASGSGGCSAQGSREQRIVRQACVLAGR